jgi:hypothetical protein
MMLIDPTGIHEDGCPAIGGGNCDCRVQIPPQRHSLFGVATGRYDGPGGVVVDRPCDSEGPAEDAPAALPEPPRCNPIAPEGLDFYRGQIDKWWPSRARG